MIVSGNREESADYIQTLWQTVVFIGHQAQLAQLVEQRTENPRVSGSIPELGIFCTLKS